MDSLRYMGQRLSCTINIKSATLYWIRGATGNECSYFSEDGHDPPDIINILNGPRVRGISPVGKEKVYGGNNLRKSYVFKFRMKD